jgi:hypothetical protein
VVRQVKVIREQLVFALPKGGKAREVPLPASVAARPRAHADEYPPVAVTLPWATPDAGESIKALSLQPGHADTGFTLRV